jgi:hypothetical protein
MLPRGLADEGDASSLLLHPEQAFTPPSPGEANFAVAIDGRTLGYGSPDILFRTNGDRVDFIAGVWRDAGGTAVHQREVLIVKPDYGVVVDHLFAPSGDGKKEHEVTSTTSLSTETLSTEGETVRFLPRKDMSGGLLVRHLSPAVSVDVTTISPGMTDPPPLRQLRQSCRITLPSPFATFLCSGGSPAPRVEFVKPANPMIVKCRVTMPDGRVDDVGIAWESRDLHLGTNHFHGWAAVSRQQPGTADPVQDIEIQQP